MGVLQFLLGHRAGDPVEPNLPPEYLERYRNLSSAERRRLVRDAEESARRSLAVDPTRDFIAERDASIQIELSGFRRQVAAKMKAEFRNPGERRLHWSVVVRQDDPPDGLWGWMIIEALVWPASVITRWPAVFATEAEARAAGEAAADAFWIAVNRELAQA